VNLMLAVMLLAVGIGLIGHDWGRGRQLAIAAMAVSMTALYFFVYRFM